MLLRGRELATPLCKVTQLEVIFRDKRAGWAEVSSKNNHVRNQEHLA